MQSNMVDSSILTRFFDTAVLAVFFVLNALVLDAEWERLITAVVGSISGSIILAYFRRDPNRGEQVFKVLCSAIGGLVLGTVLQKYLHIEAEEYKLGLFFSTSMLALVILRSLLSLTENNVAEVMRGVLQRVFNLRIETEKTKRRVHRVEREVEELKQKEGE